MRRHEKLRGAVLGLVGVCALLAVVGCGSSGGGAVTARGNASGAVSPPTSEGSGTLSIAIKFPDRDTVSPQKLPLATNSVNILVEYDGSNVVDVCLKRPDPSGGEETVSTTVDVPAGSNVVAANAYATLDCTGAIIGYATKVVDVVANQTTTVTLTIQPTVVSGTADNTDVSVRPESSYVVKTQWFDVDGNPVVPDNVTWASSNKSIATAAALPAGVDQGKITGVAKGTCKVTATAIAQAKGKPLGPLGAGVLPTPKVTIDVTVLAQGAVEIIVE